MTHDMSAARKLSEHLDEVQNRAINDSRPVDVPKEHLDLIKICLLKHRDVLPPIDQDAEKITLSAEASSIIRWLLVSYLNTLESIFSAERHSIADSTMIQEQFNYLVEEQRGNTCLAKFRSAAGGDTVYPAIADLVMKMKAKKAPPAGKRRIG